jgi:methylated-DNA-[protein]-cysteine S-methyltransferase
LLIEARRQFEDYFDGRRRDFDLPLKAAGSPFQKRVWTAMRDIPYGEVRYYGDLARQLGSGPRAIGGACGRNPLPVIVPCHRIIAADGSLGGYSGMHGLETKQFLLTLEGWSPDQR